MPTLRVNGVDIYYESAGSGPPLLLIHGLGSCTADWENQFSHFAKSRRVISMDVRGHGKSGRPPGPYSVEAFARDAVALLDELNASPADVLGLSMGGMIAFQMAVDSPKAVRSLIVLNSGPAVIFKKLSQHIMIRMRFVIIRLFGMKALGRMISRAVFPEPGQEQFRDRFAATIGANDPTAYKAALAAIIGWSVEDRIPGIRCPVLILSSDMDYTPVDWKRDYTRKIPGAELAVIESSRHMTPFDQPAALNRVVEDFLSKNSPQEVSRTPFQGTK